MNQNLIRFGVCAAGSFVGTACGYFAARALGKAIFSRKLKKRRHTYDEAVNARDRYMSKYNEAESAFCSTYSVEPSVEYTKVPYEETLEWGSNNTVTICMEDPVYSDQQDEGDKVLNTNPPAYIRMNETEMPNMEGSFETHALTYFAEDEILAGPDDSLVEIDDEELREAIEREVDFDPVTSSMYIMHPVEDKTIVYDVVISHDNYLEAFAEWQESLDVATEIVSQQHSTI